MSANVSGIELTKAAANKIKELISEEENQNLKLRVYITGGGCSGFQYGFAFEDEFEEEDIVFEQNGVSLLVDPMSMQYLQGAKVDYSEDISGAQFVIDNPSAQTTCGCGSSFSINEED